MMMDVILKDNVGEIPVDKSSLFIIMKTCSIK